MKFQAFKALRVAATVSALCLATHPFSAVAQVPSDFNGDGSSDVALVHIQSDAQQSLLWSAKLQGKRGLSQLSTFGQAGDHLLLGRFVQGRGLEFGVVHQDAQSGAVRWGLSGVDSTVSLGSGSDTIVAGADLNGSGLIDGIAVTSENGALKWQIKYDLFNSATPVSAEVLFGRVGDKPFFANVDASGDWLALLTTETDGSHRIKFKNAQTQEERGFTLSKRLAAMGVPQVVAGKDGIDRLAFVKKQGSSTAVTVLTVTGTRIARASLHGNGDLVVGDFSLRAPGQEIAVRSGRSFTLFNPFARATGKMNVASGIAVDEININSFGTSPGDGGGSNDGGNGGYVPPGIDQCGAISANDGTGKGFVWKPNSDTTFYAVAVLPGNFHGNVKSVEVYTTAGALIKALQFTGCGNPDVTGLRCNYKDFKLTGRNYRDQYGSIVLKVSLDAGGCKTYLIQDPSRRTD